MEWEYYGVLVPYPRDYPTRIARGELLIDGFALVFITHDYKYIRKFEIWLSELLGAIEGALEVDDFLEGCEIFRHVFNVDISPKAPYIVSIFLVNSMLRGRNMYFCSTKDSSGGGYLVVSIEKMDDDRAYELMRDAWDLIGILTETALGGLRPPIRYELNMREEGIQPGN